MSDTRFLEAADRLGSRLCRDAIFAQDRCNWIGAAADTPGGRGQTVVQCALGPDLYAGTSGIALFLAHLAAQTNEAVHHRTALAAAAHVRRHLAERQTGTDVGFYSGSVGLAFALIDIGKVLDHSVLVEVGLDALRGLSTIGKQPVDLDIISGSAGAILALLAIHTEHREAYLLELAVRLGEQLIESARPRDHGCSWRTIEMPMIDDLTGFSHGASGIALALLELAAVTHDARFRDTAEAGFDYERQHFNAEQENWPDFRIFDEEPPGVQRTPSYLTAWCHGAPRIGLTRLRGYELTRDPTMRREAESALRTTTRVIRDPVGTRVSYALCHGIFGNSELLLRAATTFNDESYRGTAETVALDAVERYLDDDGAWPCGVPGGSETPNLMLGLAGIGYHYLRLDDPLQNPSILLVSGKSHSVGCA